MSGYDAMLFINEKFDILISPGMIYSALYNLEREELVESKSISIKRTYKLTEKGKKNH